MYRACVLYIDERRILDVDDFTYRPGAAVGGSSAVLALQQVVGLLPERWAWPGGRSFSSAAARRAAVNPRLVFVKPTPW